jgi:hypothetical protein
MKNMKNRRDIILSKAVDINAKSYLELGLRNKNAVYNHIPCDIKHSVDINDEFATYTMSTDNFFKKLKNSELNLNKDYKWDIIFVDANHLADFVKNDVLNAFNHLNDGGILFMHDVLPTKYENQTEYGGNQTAWKSIPYLLKNHPEIHICSIPEHDGGLGVAIKNPTGNRKMLDQNFNPMYEYYIMDADRKTSQNEIKYDTLNEWISNPTYFFNNQTIEHRINMFKTHF